MRIATAPYSDRKTERHLTLDDLAVRTIVLICGLNLNGAMAMLTGVGQTFSWALLGAAIFLITRNAAKAITSQGFLFVVLIGAYLAPGMLFYTPDRSFVSPFSLSITYLNSALIILAVVSYATGISNERQIHRYMSFVRTVFVISALSTLFSPVLYSFYLHVPPSGRERMGGLFGNPNEAAIAGVLAVAFLFAYPVRQLAIQSSLMVLCAISVVLTFSKTGITTLILVGITIALLKGRLWMAMTIGLITIGTIIAQIDLREATLASVEWLELNLTSSQLSRILAIIDIFGGQIDAATTTNRTYIWQLVLSDTIERFPQSGGLGSAHFYYGGRLEGNVWQGAHNTFLMLFAEAGPIAPLLLGYLLITLAVRLWKAGPGHRGLLIALVVLTFEMSAAHNALATRYSNVALASLIGVAHALVVVRRQGGISPQRNASQRTAAIKP